MKSKVINKSNGKNENWRCLNQWKKYYEKKSLRKLLYLHFYEFFSDYFWFSDEANEICFYVKTYYEIETHINLSYVSTCIKKCVWFWNIKFHSLLRPSRKGQTKQKRRCDLFRKRKKWFEIFGACIVHSTLVKTNNRINAKYRNSGKK